MYNKHIIESPVTLFLGAGASKPLGKMLMFEFIDYLEKHKGFKRRPLFDEIVSKDRDLEFLFEELDEWIGKEYYRPYELAQKTSSIGEMIRPPGFDKEIKEFEQAFQKLLIDAHRLRSDLKREVFHAYRTISNPVAVANLFQPIFDAISISQKSPSLPLVIFTTNYDPAIEEFRAHSPAKYALHDGFFHDEDSTTYLWKRSQFDSFQPSKAKKDIVLFKIHGSTSWTKTVRGIAKSPTPIFVEDDSVHENVLIYPANRKVAIDEPFFTGYDYFQKCMENCSLCVVIGYSFRDYDSLTKLMSASRTNKRLRLLVLDPNAEAICARLEPRGIKAEPLPAALTQGPDSEDYLLALRAALLSHTA
jgi:SIR2-like domain